MKKNLFNFLYILVAVAVLGLAVYKFLYNKQSTLSFNPDKFEEMSKEPGAVLIDVRSAFEFRGDKISGAGNISFSASDFKERVQVLDKEKTYLLYCQTGNRSLMAARTMKEMGFNKVYSLRGGIENWKHLNKPVVR